VYSCASDNIVIAADISDGSEIWTHSLHTAYARDVYATDNVVYSASWDGTVKAADAADGSQIWSHNLHGVGYVVSVYVNNGVVYSASGTDSDNTVVAADASDGSELWKHNFHGANDVDAVYEANATVYSGGAGATVKAASLDNVTVSQILANVPNGTLYLNYNGEWVSHV